MCFDIGLNGYGRVNNFLWKKAEIVVRVIEWCSSVICLFP